MPVVAVAGTGEEFKDDLLIYLTFFFFPPIRPGRTNESVGDEAILVFARYEPLLRLLTLPFGVTFEFSMPEFVR